MRKRISKLNKSLRKLLSLSLAIMITLSPVGEYLGDFIKDHIEIAWGEPNQAAWGNQFSGQGYYANMGIAGESWYYPPTRIGLYRLPETVLEGKDGMKHIIERNKNNFCDASVASIILFAGGAAGYPDVQELAANTGNGTADVVNKSALVKVHSGSVSNVYYDDILANPDSYKNGGWRSKATKKSESLSTWGGILSSTGGFEQRVNQVFTVANEADYNDVDNWNDEIKKKAFARYLDMLMTLYTISDSNPTVQAQWGQAIDDYVNNVNVETTPVTVVIDTCALLNMGSDKFYVFPTIDYINFVHGIESAYAINGEAWKGSAMASAANGITRNMITESVKASVASSPSKVRGSDKMDQTNGFSWGRSYLTSGICYTTGGSVRWGGGLGTGIINNVTLQQGVNETSGSVGFGLYPAPIVGIPSGLINFRAEPDDKPVESEAIGEPALLTISSSIPENEFGTWAKMVSDAKKQGKQFEIEIEMGRANDKYGNDAQYSPNITKLIWSPAKFQEFVYGREDIIFNDLKTADKEFGDKLKLIFNYTCHFKARRLGDTTWLIDQTISDPASWTHKAERIYYTSKPEAYSELKNYGEGSDMSGYLTEDWEAMAGVPSTEQLYFAAGGSEFIVDVTLEYVQNEVAKRTFDSYWTAVDCEYKESDCWPGNWSGNGITPNGESYSYSVSISGGTNEVGAGQKTYGDHGTGTVTGGKKVFEELTGCCPSPQLEEPADPRTFTITWTYGNGKTYTYKAKEQPSEIAPNPQKPCTITMVGDPPTPKHNEDGTAHCETQYEYSLPEHALCGPCCQHRLPEIHDTWAQTWKYDSMKISDVHVWRIDQAAVTGLNAIVAKDIVAADIVTDEPAVFFNIALKNDANMVKQDGKGGATGTSKAGRVRYVMDVNQYVQGNDNAWQHDEVTWNNGVRTVNCDGNGSNGVNSETGHSKPWNDGIVYAGVSLNTGVGQQTYPTNVKNYLEDHTDAVDKNETDNQGKKKPEYKTWYEQRKTKMQATMITDFLILDTTSGNQSVMYFHKNAPSKVTNEEEIPELDVTKEEMWDSNGKSAAKWKPDHINVGGYNGNYQDIGGKFDGSGRQNIADGETFFEPDPAKTIVRPQGPNEKLMLYEGELNITLQDVNKSYRTEYAQVFWANALHWSDASSKFYSGDPPKFTGGAPYATQVGPIGRDPNKTWFVNYENHTFTYDGQSDARTANHDPEGLPGGHVLNAPYSPAHEKINDIIVHDPVSTEYAFIESLPDERDQRVTDTLIGTSDKTMDDINNNKVCPRDPALCEFRHLNCTYFKDTVLASFNFENAKVSGSQWLVTNDISKNQFRMPAGFTVENSGKLNTGKYLNARGVRWEIPFSELRLDYSPTLNVQVEADVVLEPSNTNTMLFSFYGYSLYLPANSNKISFNTGNGIGKQSSKVVADGKKHNIKAIFNFYDANNSKIYIDGVEATYDKINDNLDITSVMVGKSFYIGSWGANTSYSAKFWLDNLKITRLKGTSQHTDACYRLEMMHPEGLNYHNHTVACLDDVTDPAINLGYTGSVQEVFLEPGIYKFEAWGASGGGNEPGANTAPAEYEWYWTADSNCTYYGARTWSTSNTVRPPNPGGHICGTWELSGNVKNTAPGSQGGKGGYAQGLYSIAKGTYVQVYVGGQGASNTRGVGGWNGGGAANGGGGAGGGGTDIRISSTNTGSMRFDLNNKLVRIPGTNEYPSGTAVTSGAGQGFRGPYITVGAGTYQVDLHGSGLTNGQLRVYGSSGAIDWTSRATAIRRADNSVTYLVNIPSDNNSVEFRYIANNGNPMSIECEYITSFDDRVIVAGGGGGADNSPLVSGDFNYDAFVNPTCGGAFPSTDGYSVNLNADGFDANWVTATSKLGYSAGTVIEFDYKLRKDYDCGSIRGDLSVYMNGAESSPIWRYSTNVNGGQWSSEFNDAAVWRHARIVLPSTGTITFKVYKTYHRGNRYHCDLANMYINGVRKSFTKSDGFGASGYKGGDDDGTGGHGGGYSGNNGQINGVDVVGTVRPGENTGLGGLGGTQDGGFKQWQGEPTNPANGDAGAGGGGYWGGLASTNYNGGGGGGSSYVGNLGAGSTTAGVNWGNGKVRITKISGAKAMADAINGGLFRDDELHDILGEAYDPIMVDAYGKLIYSWKNWTTANMHEFSALQQCTISANNGNLLVQGTGSDSRVVVPVKFDASGVEKIEVIMDNASASTRGTMRWTRADSTGWDATKLIHSSVYSANSNNQKFSFIVKGKGQWKGTVNKIAFDFINTNGSATIKAINIYGTGPVTLPNMGTGDAILDSSTPGIYTINNAVGQFKVELWGAQGGEGYSGNAGALGGYTTGTITLTSPQTLYIAVGGQGAKGNGSSVAGGFNGGGRTTTYGGGGGGATHIATANGELRVLSGNTGAVLMVAGGGGGNAGHNVGSTGIGGGLVGGEGTQNYGTSGKGGTQDGPGATGRNGSPAGFGFGGDNLVGYGNGGGGGGAGWYGGGAGGNDYSSYRDNDDSGGGGGSGYIGGVPGATTTAGVNSGNGRARVVSLHTPLTIGAGQGFVTAGTRWDFDRVWTADNNAINQSWTAPATVLYKLEAWGAQGGNLTDNGNRGGLGGYASGEIRIQAGTSFELEVGPQGYSNTSTGGALPAIWQNGGAVGGHGSGGGSGTAIRVGYSGDYDYDLWVAAGGGGGASHNGGSGLPGGTTTTLPANAQPNNPGATNVWAQPGIGGGKGGSCSSAGAGGISYVKNTLSNATFAAGQRTGDGHITITALESSFYNNVKPETIRKYWMLLPDYVSTGEINPIWSCKLEPKNEHRCDLSKVPCTEERVLYCTEPHHKNLHYDSSNPICWEACGNDENHKLYKPVINLADGSFVPGNFINIDYGYRACFPNIGDFYDGEPHGIGALTDQRGLAFIDQMDTTKWTRVKRIKFEWNAIYDDFLYLSNEWIVLGDRGVYTGAPQSKYSEAKWTNHGTKLEAGIKQIWYDFYSVLANYEAKSATAEFEVEAVNCPGPNDNKETMNNKERTSTFTALHGGYKTWYIDVVGRIGNLIIEDVGDYRYSNLFKVPIKNNDGFTIAPITYTPSSGLDAIDGATETADSIKTNSAGAGAQLGVSELKPGQYRIDILGTGLNNGRLKVSFKDSSGDWIDTREDYTRRIIVSNKQVARYMNIPVPDVAEGEEASLDPREVKIEWVSNNTNQMEISEVTLRYLGDKAESWMLDGIVWDVDEARQNYYMTWIQDIRGEAISNKTNYLNTYGTRTWIYDVHKEDLNVANKFEFIKGDTQYKDLILPLSPDKNNIDILRDEPMLIGYDIYTDITTLGNYFLNNSSRLDVVPYYYAYDLNNPTDPLIELDVYVNHEGSYQPINIYDLVHPGWDQSKVFDYMVNLNWLEENVRRNYTDSEKLRTDTLKEMEEFREDIVAGDGTVTGSKQLDAPVGEHYKLGNGQAMVSTGKARTFVGGETTYNQLKNLNEGTGGGTPTEDDYGVLKNDRGRIPDYLWWKSAQRWHMKLGLPSSAVVVRHGVEPTVDTIKEFTSKNYVVLCTADIRAVGDTYILKYDQFGHNGRMRLQNEEGTWVTVDLPSNIPTVFGVFSTVKSSMHDIDIVGTH